MNTITLAASPEALLTEALLTLMTDWSLEAELSDLLIAANDAAEDRGDSALADSIQELPMPTWNEDDWTREDADEAADQIRAILRSELAL